MCISIPAAAALSRAGLPIFFISQVGFLSLVGCSAVVIVGPARAYRHPRVGTGCNTAATGLPLAARCRYLCFLEFFPPLPWSLMGLAVLLSLRPPPPVGRPRCGLPTAAAGQLCRPWRLAPLLWRSGPLPAGSACPPAVSCKTSPWRGHPSGRIQGIGDASAPAAPMATQGGALE